MALRAFQALGILAVFKVGFAGRTDQHLEKVFGEHSCGIIRHNRRPSAGGAETDGSGEQGMEACL